MQEDGNTLLNLDKEPTVSVGSTIDFTIKSGKKERLYSAYAVKEALTAKGHEIAISSPMGKAIAGKKQGDSVSYNVDGFEITINIVKVITQ